MDVQSRSIKGGMCPGDRTINTVGRPGGVTWRQIRAGGSFRTKRPDQKTAENTWKSWKLPEKGIRIYLCDLQGLADRIQLDQPSVVDRKTRAAQVGSKGSSIADNCQFSPVVA